MGKQTAQAKEVYSISNHSQERQDFWREQPYAFTHFRSWCPAKIVYNVNETEAVYLHEHRCVRYIPY